MASEKVHQAAFQKTVELDEIDFEKSADGLVPAVVQDARTGEVLMLAFQNREALEHTLKTGQATFWSRSRQALWRKGEESGNVQHVLSAHTDCDRDTVVLKVAPAGPACHLGERSCFFRSIEGLEKSTITESMPTPELGARSHPGFSDDSHRRTSELGVETTVLPDSGASLAARETGTGSGVVVAPELTSPQERVVEHRSGTSSRTLSTPEVGVSSKSSSGSTAQTSSESAAAPDSGARRGGISDPLPGSSGGPSSKAGAGEIDQTKSASASELAWRGATGAVSGAESGFGAESRSGAGTGSESGAGAESGTGSGSESGAESGIGSGYESGSGSGAGSGARSGSGAGPRTGTEAESESGSESGAGSLSEPRAVSEASSKPSFREGVGTGSPVSEIESGARSGAESVAESGALSKASSKPSFGEISGTGSAYEPDSADQAKGGVEINPVAPSSRIEQLEVLLQLEETLESRRKAPPEGSYVAKLYADETRRHKKIGEEATELVVASLQSSRGEVVSEAADLLFHTLVLLRSHGVSLGEVAQVLEKRVGAPRRE